jgi:hypothetical protein
MKCIILFSSVVEIFLFQNIKVEIVTKKKLEIKIEVKIECTNIKFCQNTKITEYELF